MQRLGSLLYTTWLFIGTLVYAIVLILMFWLSDRQRSILARSWACNQLWMLEKLCGLSYQVRGQENILQENHISMWKHSSSWETIAQAAILPAQSWVLKRELMWIPIVGWAVRMLRPIAIDRKAGSAAFNQLVEEGKRHLDNGRWVVIFPEGTRMPAGTTRKYGVGGAMLAAQTGRKVVPVAHNAGHFWPRRGLMKKPGTIQVVIGPPIETKGRHPREINEEVQRWIEGTLATMETIGAREPSAAEAAKHPGWQPPTHSSR